MADQNARNPNLPASALYWGAVLCFLVSGVAGLVYQVVWMRYLGLFLGHTSYAIVAVLASFMGGLAIGNAVLGRMADRTAKPLALYGWLELLIAAYAFLFPVYFELLYDTYVHLATGMEAGGTASRLLKFGFAVFSVTTPAVLMGGTLPILTRTLTRGLGELQAKVSTLYFINSAGAVVGVIIGHFWLVPGYGLETTVFIGGGLNAIVGMVALGLSVQAGEGNDQETAAQEQKEDDSAVTFTPLEHRMAVIGIGVSGFCAMLYELAWTRLLALAVGSSSDAYALMLITFITGIAIGAWIVGRLPERRCGMKLFGWLEVAVGGSTMAMMFCYHYLPYLFLRVSGWIARDEANYAIYQVAQSSICFLVMILPTVCLGMTLPVVSRIATANVKSSGRSVGIVFSVNTLGTVIGTVLTGFWLLPQLGLARTLALGNAFNLCLGVAILLRNNRPLFPRIIAPGSLAGAILVVVVAGHLLDRRWQQTFSMGHWRWKEAPGSYAEFKSMIGGALTKFYRDGADSSVSIQEVRGPVSTNLFLTVNGKSDASTSGDMATQMMLGHVPALLHPNPKSVLIIGLGSGVTAGSVLQHPDVESVEVVEMSPDVIRAAAFFRDHNHDALNHSRLKLIHEDAKAHLLTAGRTYDLIISEPSNPWMAGVAGVFTREYFASCRKHLNPGGLMVQWFHRYEASDETFETVAATFSEAYPNSSLWQGSGRDVIFVGTATDATAFDVKRVVERFNLPSVRADLDRIGMDRPSVFLATQIMPFGDVPYIARPGTPLHSDYFPILEHLGQRGFFARKDSELVHRFDQRMQTRARMLFQKLADKTPVVLDDIRAIARYSRQWRILPDAVQVSLLERWRELAPDDPLQGFHRVQVEDPAGQDRDLLRLFKWRAGSNNVGTIPLSTGSVSEYARRCMSVYRKRRSMFHRPDTTELELLCEKTAQIDPVNQRVYHAYVAELLWDRGAGEAANRWAERAFGQIGGPHANASFELDWFAAKKALAIMIEHQLTQGSINGAAAVVDAAIQMGHIDLSHRVVDDIVLETAVRRVRAARRD